MKVRLSEIKEIVNHYVDTKLSMVNGKNAFLKENQDFLSIVALSNMLDSTMLQFEEKIREELNLADLNKLDPELQQIYLDITKEMKENIKKVLNASIEKLGKFPRNNPEEQPKQQA